MQNPKNILKEVYGYDEFRPLQQEIIEHTLSGQHSVVIMPTGGGKSVCFQIPALIFDKVTLVISPLISLMRDQVESLKANGVAAAYFNSSQSDFEKRMILEECRSNKLKLLYLSPETLVHAFDSWLKDIPVSFVAVDEAHCVSMWGHDFRPEYAQLKNFRNHYKNVPFMALTATADKITRKDIAEQLGLDDPQLFLSSFNRANLSLAVRPQVPAKQKEKEIIQFIGERKNESGIIYCLSRKETEKWSAFLNSNGFNARHYHAGMSSESREAVQDGFINDQFTIICATIAFGMGIDKSNVRWIIHNNLPKNIEGYYQEIGRAGRDGLPSDTVLYYNYRDVILLNDFVQESEFKETYLEKIKRMIQYAEATSCRRNILLSYFGEYNDEPCNNCDVCQNPPEFLDGKIITQMAVSAILRTQENIGSTMLINILRGAKTAELFEKNYQTIKTYGVGNVHSYAEWQHYINQLINLGFIEIAYDDHLKLKITSEGNAILKNDKKVQLTRFVTQANKKKKEKDEKSEKKFAQPVEQSLFEALRTYRKEIAAQNKVPAYVIFHDATLNEIASIKPKNEAELLEIQGMGKLKLERFGAAILNLVNNHKPIPIPTKLSTSEQTLALYNQGLELEEIAEERNLSPTTIIGHLCKLFEENHPIDLNKYVTEYEVNQIRSSRKKLKNTNQLKPIYEDLNGEIDFQKIAIGLTILSKYH